MTPEVKERIEQIRQGKVPEGYKKGKIGIIPVDWEEVPFSTLFTSTSDYTDDLAQYPLYSLTIEDGITAKTERYERSHLVKKENSYKIVRPNDYAYNPMNIRFGAVARHKGNNAVAVSGYYDIFTTVHESDLAFMDSFLTCGAMITYYNKVSTGSLIEKQRVHFSDFLEFSIPLPPLEERKKIAELLILQDQVIELKEKRISEKQLQKKYYRRKLFAQSSIDMKRVCLSDVCSINDDTIKENSLHTSFYYIDISCVETGHINKPSTKMLFEDAPVRARRKIQNGDILLSTVRPYLHAFAIVNFSANDYIASTGFSVLRPRNSVATEIIFQQLISEDMDRQFTNLLVGTNYPAINSTDVGRLKVWMPSDSNVIERISKLFSTIDTEIELLQKDLEQEKQKKKALMQLLLTGIVRVSV